MLEMLFWQFHLIMQVMANVFITAIHGLHGDTSAVALTEGPAMSSSLPRSALPGSLFVRLGGQNESSLSCFMCLACTQAVLQ